MNAAWTSPDSVDTSRNLAWINSDTLRLREAEPKSGVGAWGEAAWICVGSCAIVRADRMSR
jgi:hypothetical protein